MFQGDHRLQRGKIYFNYIQHFYDSTVVNFQEKAVISGVGHNHSDIFTSNCGKYYIFNYGSCNSVNSLFGNTSSVSSDFILHQNYPNPFNSGTIISFTQSKKSQLNVKIYDVSGTLIKIIVRGKIFSKGSHSVYWDGTNQKEEKVGSGIYFAVLYADKFTDMKRMILLK